MTAAKMTAPLKRVTLLAAGAAAFCVLASVPARAMEFKPYGRGSFEELRKARAGRPLVVHFWSATCAPCLAELPEWSKITREAKSFDVVFVSTDRGADRTRAETRLDKAGLAQATHYGFADAFAERLYFEADKTWRGELPFTALVGADGGLVTVIGAVDDPLIASWLEKSGK